MKISNRLVTELSIRPEKQALAIYCSMKNGDAYE